MWFLWLIMIYIEAVIYLLNHQMVDGVVEPNLMPNNSSLFSAIYNSREIRKRLVNNSHVVIPDNTYYIHPIYRKNIYNAILQIDGKLVAHPRIDKWPRNDTYNDIFNLNTIQNFTIKGNGTVDGQGSIWWEHALKHRKKDTRGCMFRIKKAKELYITGIKVLNSPKFYFNIKESKGIYINDIEIHTDWDKKQPYFPFNTDGIDIEGSNVIISNSKITNYDDAVAIKPHKQGSCTKDILVENMTVKYGVGMSVGSVPPNEKVNCIENVIFRNIVFHEPIKAIYIKTNPGNDGYGLINNITYENIKIHSPKWFSLYVGPQQQREPDGDGPGCLMYPIEKCPTEPRITIGNITFKNITSDKDTLNVLRCNETNPCKNFQFIDVDIKGHFIVENIEQ